MRKANQPSIIYLEVMQVSWPNEITTGGKERPGILSCPNMNQLLCQADSEAPRVNIAGRPEERVCLNNANEHMNTARESPSSDFLHQGLDITL
jgi:hypothetical protein